jgi:hypothetical protein
MFRGLLCDLMIFRRIEFFRACQLLHVLHRTPDPSFCLEARS